MYRTNEFRQKMLRVNNATLLFKEMVFNVNYDYRFAEYKTKLLLIRAFRQIVYDVNFRRSANKELMKKIASIFSSLNEKAMIEIKQNKIEMKKLVDKIQF